MFASTQLAARIDRAEGRLCAGIARIVAADSPELRSEVFDISGGMAVYAGPGSPTNKMIGIGFDGMPGEGGLDRVERAFADRGAPLQAEVSTLAEPSLPGCLVRRGYEPHAFENVFGYPLSTLDRGVGLEANPTPDLTVERATTGDIPGWIEVMVEAFAAPDQGGVGGEAPPPADELRRWLVRTMNVPGFEPIVARISREIVGGASLRLDSGVAQFSGAATLPSFRRRGVQTALVRWRLGHARASGCDIAVVVTQPASRSQQNVQREGFHLLYARQLLTKSP